MTERQTPVAVDDQRQAAELVRINRNAGTDEGEPILDRNRLGRSDQGGIVVEVGPDEITTSRMESPERMAGTPLTIDGDSAMDVRNRFGARGPERLGIQTLSRIVKTLDTAIDREEVDPDQLQLKDGSLEFGGRSWGLSEHGWPQLCRELGAKGDYLRRFDEPIPSMVMNAHLERGDQLPKWGDDVPPRYRRLVVCSMDGEFMGFARADLTHLSGSETLRTAVEGIEDLVAVDELTGTIEIQDGGAWEVNLISRERSGEIRERDFMHGGLTVTHTPSGGMATTVEGYYWREFCSNGMKRRHCVNDNGPRRIRKLPVHEFGSVDKYRDQIRRSARHYLRDLDQEFERIRALAEQRIIEGSNDDDRDWNRRRFLARILGQAGRLRSKHLIDALVAAWEPEDVTRYGALNAMTYVATHNPTGKVTLANRQALARLAGILAGQSHHFCDKCFSILAA